MDGSWSWVPCHWMQSGRILSTTHLEGAGRCYVYIHIYISIYVYIFHIGETKRMYNSTWKCPVVRHPWYHYWMHVFPVIGRILVRDFGVWNWHDQSCLIINGLKGSHHTPSNQHGVGFPTLLSFCLRSYMHIIMETWQTLSNPVYRLPIVALYVLEVPDSFVYR